LNGLCCEERSASRIHFKSVSSRFVNFLFIFIP
jgi:hypothetical protein